jgi:putative ABC transport system substrate-binding protein
MSRINRTLSVSGAFIASCLCLLLILLLVVTPSISFGQDKKVVIGVVKIVSHPALDADEKGFEESMAGAGFKDGAQVTYNRRSADGDMAKAEAIAKQFVDQKVDLIHSIATPTTQAVLKHAKNIPVVFSSITDPVSAGIVPSDSFPGKKTGTNVTGVSDRWPVLLQTELYAKFVPKAKKWGTIYNPAEPNSVTHIKEMREASKKLGLELVEATVASGKEVEQAAVSLAGKVNAIMLTSDNTAFTNFEAIVKVCNEKKIPLFTGDIDSVSKGAVAAYGLDYYLIGYSAGKKAALVLKGTKPGDIPWGPVEKFSLYINQGAAKAQGLTIPPELLKKADKVFK